MSFADKRLKELEKSINREYTKAYQECKKEMADIMVKISVNPDMPLDEKMVITNKYNRLDKMCEQMASTLKDTNKTAIGFINNSNANIFKTVYNLDAKKLGFSLIDNTAVKNILTEKANPFTKLAFENLKDKTVIARQLKSEMITSLLKGESIPNIANRIKIVAEGYLKDSIKIARTETTYIENSAHQSIGEQGKELGFNMWKRWVATTDDRTRESHIEADGQEVPENEPFIVGGEELMFPGDCSMGASPENIINCRCTMVVFIKS